jgi:hypothetical protein
MFDCTYADQCFGARNMELNVEGCCGTLELRNYVPDSTMWCYSLLCR